MQYIKNFCTKAYIKCNMSIANYKNLFQNKIREYFYVNDIKVNRKTVWWRFVMIMFMCKMRDACHNVIKMLDIKPTSLQMNVISKKYEKKIIVDNKSLQEIFYYLQENNICDRHGLYKDIITEFYIRDNNDKMINIRNDILDYKDDDMRYNHTIENILKHNYDYHENMFINGTINITRFTRNGISKTQFCYNDHKTKHINFFFE